MALPSFRSSGSSYSVGRRGRGGRVLWASLECGDITSSHMATPHFKGSRCVPERREHRFVDTRWPAEVLPAGSLPCLFKTLCPAAPPPRPASQWPHSIETWTRVTSMKPTSLRQCPAALKPRPPPPPVFPPAVRQALSASALLHEGLGNSKHANRHGPRFPEGLPVAKAPLD